MEHWELVSGESMKESADLVNLVESTSEVPVLGLKLSKTPSFLQKVHRFFNGEEQAMSDGNQKENVWQQGNKMKAENFLISLLRIGSWQRVSRNDGDLVGKCYFAKRKLVWEFLENGLKSKIEIQWSDILSLKAVLHEGQPGILELELIQPPSFYREIDPQPRKHTQWRMSSDFTGGQALTYRRHYLEFPPGVLDRPLDKLFCYDHRLSMLSQQGFPTLDSPYFLRHTFGGFSLDFGGQFQQSPQQQQQQQQLSFANVPTHYQTYHPAPLSSPISGILSLLPFHNPGFESMDVQSSTRVEYVSCNIVMEFSEYNYMSSQEGQLGGLIPHHRPSMFQPSNDHRHQSMLFSNSTRMSEVDLFMQEHPMNNIVSPNAVDNGVLMNNVVGGGRLYPQAMNWSPDDNSFSSSVVTDDFGHETNNWTHDLSFRQWR